MTELWKPIKGWEGKYEVSNLGVVKNAITGHILKQHDAGYGYMQVLLSRSRRNKSHALVHRLVAQAFVPNPNNLPQVNHKDENKYNNLPHNLEWCTAMYNMHYGEASKIRWENARKALSKAVIQSKNGIEIARFPSLKAAAKALGVHSSSIHQALNGRSHFCKGFQWYYEERSIT